MNFSPNLSVPARLVLTFVTLVTITVGQEENESLEWRKWNRGTQIIEASLKGLVDGKFILQSRDGRTATFATKEFSAPDIAYAKDRLVQQLALAPCAKFR